MTLSDENDNEGTGRRSESDGEESTAPPAEGGSADVVELDDDVEDEEEHAPRLRINPGESEDYDEWRNERRHRGRKSRTKRGGRRRGLRDDDLA
jgi:hypothetical protein